MKLLALDISSTTGFCIGEPGAAHPRFGSFTIPKRFSEDELGAKAAFFENELCDLITVERPTHMAIEAPLPVFGGSSLKTRQRTVQLLNGLAMLAEKIAYLRDIDCEEANLSKVRKWFCGKGNARKPEIIAQCVNVRGWKIADDHQADAGAIWAFVGQGMIERAGRVA